MKNPNCPIQNLGPQELHGYVDLVHFIAKRMIKRLPKNVEIDDLISAGLVGLAQSLEKFDPKKGTGFKAFAEFRIRGAMLDELRAQDWAPKGIRQKVKQYHAVVEKILQTTGHNPSGEEIREHLKLNKKSYDRLTDAVRTLDQMNAATYQNPSCETDNNLDNICDLHPDPDMICAQHDLRNYFVKGMLSLDEKTQKILMLYYFEDQSFKEIAQELEISESRVSQLHAAGIKSLKESLKNTAGDAIDMVSSAA